MKVTSNNKINKVYSALMGQKIGTKLEIFRHLNFLINLKTQKK